MKLQINLELCPCAVQQLIDLVSDAQNTYAERMTMAVVTTVKEDTPPTGIDFDLFFLQCRYREYTELLQILHASVQNAKVIHDSLVDEK